MPESRKTPYVFASKLDQGSGRKTQEDNALAIAHPKMFLGAIFDGMGGHAAGEVASRMARETVEEHFQAKRDDLLSGTVSPKEFFEKAIKEAHQRITEEAQRWSQGVLKMGTTATIALVLKGKLHIGHVGDSRAYMVREKEMRQLTEDHNMYADWIRRGDKNPPLDLKNTLTQAVGGSKEPEVQVVENVELKPGEKVLLCSDGLHDDVSDADIRKLARGETEKELEHSIGALIEKARTEPRENKIDNIGIVLYRHGEEEQEVPTERKPVGGWRPEEGKPQAKSRKPPLPPLEVRAEDIMRVPQVFQKAVQEKEAAETMVRTKTAIAPAGEERERVREAKASAAAERTGEKIARKLEKAMREDVAASKLEILGRYPVLHGKLRKAVAHGGIALEGLLGVERALYRRQAEAAGGKERVFNAWLKGAVQRAVALEPKEALRALKEELRKTKRRRY